MGRQGQGSAWKGLYYAGSVAALIAVLLFRRNFAAEMDIFNGFGIFPMPTVLPASAADWFKLLQEAPLTGLILLDLVDVINYGLVGLIFLALFGALYQTAKSAMVTATAFGFVGIALFLAANQAFAMLALSNKFAAAATTAQQAQFLAAGEALLAIARQGTGIYLSLLLLLLAGLTISVVMLRSDVFGRWTGVTGILANSLALGYFLALVFIPTLIWLPPTLSAPLRITWYILIAIKLFKLGKEL